MYVMQSLCSYSLCLRTAVFQITNPPQMHFFFFFLHLWEPTRDIPVSPLAVLSLSSQGTQVMAIKALHAFFQDQQI